MNLCTASSRRWWFVHVDVVCEQEEDDELKANILNSYRLTAKKEHTRILQRRQVIEERKEQLENLNDMRVGQRQSWLELLLHWFCNSLYSGV